MQWWIGVPAALVVGWVALVVGLYVGSRGRDRIALTDAVRLLPDLVRLLRRLAGDPAVPRRVRVVLGLTIGYLLLPVDLIPDVLPVLGQLDDVVVVVLALRAVVRAAGPAALDRHWPGTPAGLGALRRAAGLPTGGDDVAPGAAPAPAG
ncbi:YkvA family protein [Pseudonocardia spirodelae]|uniref:DUF1232 domain-containing protein n=1 Tax=Pseudonocardia spirodelae TaxID=3133431 RepID=A0ABU8T9M1_9PSEU